MTAPWTPGPWTPFERPDDNIRIFAMRQPNGARKLCVFDGANLEANARLAALAPEMADFLVWTVAEANKIGVVDSHAFRAEAAERARALLARARGETL